MRNRIKLTLRRWAIRRLIRVVDHAEEWLQNAQVRLRNDLSGLRELRQHPTAQPKVARTCFTGEIGEWSESDLLSPSAEKREQYDSWNSKARPLGHSDDAGGVASLTLALWRGKSPCSESYCAHCIHLFQNAVLLAAKVRGYFRDRWGKTEWEGMESIPPYLTGDRDLYDLASTITKRSISPGRKTR